MARRLHHIAFVSSVLLLLPFYAAWLGQAKARLRPVAMQPEPNLPEHSATQSIEAKILELADIRPSFNSNLLPEPLLALNSSFADLFLTFPGVQLGLSFAANKLVLIDVSGLFFLAGHQVLPRKIGSINQPQAPLSFGLARLRSVLNAQAP